MDIVPGTQSGEAKERDLNRHGYKSEMVSKQADRWSLRRLANQKDALPSLSFNLTSGTHLSLTNQWRALILNSELNPSPFPDAVHVDHLIVSALAHQLHVRLEERIEFKWGAIPLSHLIWQVGPLWSIFPHPALSLSLNMTAGTPSKQPIRSQQFLFLIKPYSWGPFGLFLSIRKLVHMNPFRNNTLAHVLPVHSY